MLSHFQRGLAEAPALADGADDDGRYGEQGQSQPYDARRRQNGGVTRRGRA
jgi:hypothetical protein